MFGIKNESEKRFIIKRPNGKHDYTYLIVDKETGVQYLYHLYCSGGGMSVLVDADGKPLLDKN